MLLLALSPWRALAEPRMPSQTHLGPSWVEHYRVRTKGSGTSASQNASYLEDVQASCLNEDLISQLMDPQQALRWRQQYEDISRDFEMRNRAGIASTSVRNSYDGAVHQFGDNVMVELQRWHTRKVERRAVSVAQRDEAVKIVLTPAVLVAGISLGRPVRVKLTDDLFLSLRTDMRAKFGVFEIGTPLGLGSFEFRPLAPEHRQLTTSNLVDFGLMFNLGYLVDYSQERYQFGFSRGLEQFGLTSRLLYGASSNTVVGSLSKRITGNLSAVVDTIHWLSPISSTQAGEQKVRLRYDFNF